jgi:predicted RNase H-like HicB family nuclease
MVTMSQPCVDPLRGFVAMKFLITLTQDEDQMWVAECPSIPGCVSQGESRDEAINNVREAIAACLETRAERGMPLTVETQQVGGKSGTGAGLST